MRGGIWRLEKKRGSLPDAQIIVRALRTFASARGDVFADVASCSAEISAVGRCVDVIRKRNFPTPTPHLTTDIEDLLAFRGPQTVLPYAETSISGVELYVSKAHYLFDIVIEGCNSRKSSTLFK